MTCIATYFSLLGARGIAVMVDVSRCTQKNKQGGALLEVSLALDGLRIDMFRLC